MHNLKIAVIGLGYVGLPLATSLSSCFNVIGYDVNALRIKELSSGFDRTEEVKKKSLKNKNINFTNRKKDLVNCDIYIITVPTPVNKKNTPDLKNLILATKTVAKNLNFNNVVIYESTVYPGCTDDICIPLLEKYSGLKINIDFFVGYSPERIDPGVSKFKLKNQIKIISASNNKALKILNFIYSKIINKKLYAVENIKTAEASKIIENTQRDINIAFMNEVAMLFKKLNINTNQVLNAAKTKWNFLDFKPGLVGGHCIGVDPYYLMHKAKKIGFNSKIITAGRKVNDKIPNFIFSEIIKICRIKQINFKKLKILFLGVAFKENCVDCRNSKAIELLQLIKKKNNSTEVYDPVVNKSDFLKNFKIKLLDNIYKKNYYDLIIVAVPHKKIRKIGLKKIKKFGKKELIIFDIKSIFKKSEAQWQL